MQPTENYNTADTSSADIEKTLLPLHFHIVHWNFCWMSCKLCMKWDFLWYYVLVLQTTDLSNYFCQRFWLWNLFFSMQTALDSLSTQLHILLTFLLHQENHKPLNWCQSWALGSLCYPNLLICIKRWNLATYRAEVMLCKPAKAPISSAWLPACKHNLE